jgi:hypothetical protein
VVAVVRLKARYCGFTPAALKRKEVAGSIKPSFAKAQAVKYRRQAP